MTALNSTGPRPTRLAGLIGSVVLLVGLANACQSVDQSPTDTTSSSGSIAPSASASPTVSGPADEALLAVTATRQFVDSVGGEYPKLRPRVARLSGVHVAHETLLQELTGTTPTDPPSAGSVPTSPARAEAGVRAAESRLARTLADLAVSSEDGPTGRALASMSAGTSQIAASTGWPGTRGATESESDSITLSADQTLAVQSVLEREHASLWWYGVLGGRTSAALQPGLIPKLTSGYEAHRRQRDELTAILVNQGVAPAAAEPDVSDRMESPVRSEERQGGPSDRARRCGVVQLDGVGDRRGSAGVGHCCPPECSDPRPRRPGNPRELPWS